MSSKISHKSRQADFFSVCVNCPLCCCNGARPPVTSKRKRIIQDFLNAKGFRGSNPFEERDYTFLRETEDGRCIFLDTSTMKCQIHHVKPETCVAGPVTFDINLKTKKIEWLLKMEKICPLSGILCEHKEALEKHIKSAKREILRLVRDLDAQALRIILAIEEPDTFKIDEDSLNSKIVAKLKT